MKIGFKLQCVECVTWQNSRKFSNQNARKI